VIEAYWLFGVPPEKIEVVIHPQSLIHSMVEFADGSMKAQLSIPDMKLPILYALAYPDRLPFSSRRIDFGALREMTFQPPTGRSSSAWDLHTAHSRWGNRSGGVERGKRGGGSNVPRRGASVLAIPSSSVRR